MSAYHPALYPGGIFHILSHAVGNELLFRNDENYRFFLAKYNQYISPVADTYCYCLLPNHFHFMIRIKNESAVKEHFSIKKPAKDFSKANVPGFIMERFSNLLNSYAKSYNKVYRRMGSLFVDYLRRVEVNNSNHFGSTVFYIHKNPVHHGCCKKIEDWKWTSYHSLLSNKPTALLRDEVLDWFGSIEKFIEFHKQPIYLKGLENL
jgi:putative transposase